MKRMRGFTLLEVMLAFVLLAAAMGLVIAMLSRGLKQVQRSQSASEAMMYAQSYLDEFGMLAPVLPDSREGEFGEGRYRYRLQVEEITDPSPDASTQAPVEALDAARLYRVVLDVSWGAATRDQRLHLVTLRARKPVVLPGAAR